MGKKTRIVAALGEHRLLGPFLLNQSLAANDRPVRGCAKTGGSNVPEAAARVVRRTVVWRRRFHHRDKPRISDLGRPGSW